MLRDKFNKILEKHYIFGEDAEEILLAVHEMICLVADELKEKEPYATVTIDRLENTAYELFDLSCNLDYEEA